MVDKHHHLNALLRESYFCIHGNVLVFFPTQLATPLHPLYLLTKSENFLYNWSHQLPEFFQWSKNPPLCPASIPLTSLPNSLSDPTSSYPQLTPHSTQPLLASLVFLELSSFRIFALCCHGSLVIGWECPTPTCFSWLAPSPLSGLNSNVAFSGVFPWLNFLKLQPLPTPYTPFLISLPCLIFLLMASYHPSSILFL